MESPEDSFSSSVPFLGGILDVADKVLTRVLDSAFGNESFDGNDAVGHMDLGVAKLLFKLCH